MVEDDEQRGRGARTPLEGIFKACIVEWSGKSDDALMRFVRKLREETAALETDLNSGLRGKSEQLAQRRIPSPLIRDVDAQQMLSALQRFFDCVNAVNNAVEIDRLTAAYPPAVVQDVPVWLSRSSIRSCNSACRS